MTEFSRADFVKWCSQRGLSVDSSGHVVFNDGIVRTTYSIRLPDSPNRRIALLANLLHQEKLGFDGAATWLQSWAIAEEHVMPLLYERIRVSYGLSDVVKGHLGLEFTAENRNEAMLFFGLFLVAGWDSYFIPTNASYILFSSNDNFLDLTLRDTDLEHGIFSGIAGEWDVTPTPPGNPKIGQI